MARPVQIAHVSVTLDGERNDYEVPAYTQDPSEFADRMATFLANYILESQRASQSVSTGDYAFLLIALASTEPREQ